MLFFSHYLQYNCFGVAMWTVLMLWMLLFGWRKLAVDRNLILRLLGR